jgi:hypothetical protein
MNILCICNQNASERNEVFLSNLLNILSALSNLPFCRHSIYSGARGKKKSELSEITKSSENPHENRMQLKGNLRSLTNPDKIKQHIAGGGVVTSIHELWLGHFLVACLQCGKK